MHAKMKGLFIENSTFAAHSLEDFYWSSLPLLFHPKKPFLNLF